MSRARKRAVAAMLLVFSLWPLAQHALVQRFRMNPWKFFGFAMYTTHVLKPAVEVYALDGGRRLALPIPERELPEAEAERRRLRASSHHCGLLARPDRLARLVRDALAPSEGVEVVVVRPYIDPRTGRVTATRESHLYLADGRVIEELGAFGR
ncbi:MAG: hypothetical protein KC560_15590 [Myxococcales bacterium]|nr:hypothetical protein [Myxococcales bacterium]